MKITKRWITLLMLIIGINLQAQKFDGLAKTPPMGWNSWNKFSCDVSEALIKETADAMVSSGLKDAGYEYIVIDDCWHGERDSLGFIQADPVRFPSGIKALADYVHSKGLKFGIYSDAGWKTCGGRPGSRGREYQDAMTYASWGVDYLKYDWCNTEGLKGAGAYLTIRDALYEAGRPIVLSICEWGDGNPWEWAGPIGHLWRTTGDIYNCFDCEEDHGTWSSWGVLQILDMRKDIRKYAGPDHWNDPDMMEVGNGMSTIEDKSHFSLWAMMAAPLIAGNDIRKMSAETKAILSNKNIIAIDQDTLGIQGYKHGEFGGCDVWVKTLAGGDLAVCFLNRDVEAKSFQYDWKSQKFKDPDFEFAYEFASTKYDIKDLWADKKIGSTAKPTACQVDGHGVLMLRLTKSK
jgi:alpha-galactosidase